MPKESDCVWIDKSRTENEKENAKSNNWAIYKRYKGKEEPFRAMVAVLQQL